MDRPQYSRPAMWGFFIPFIVVFALCLLLFGQLLHYLGVTTDIITALLLVLALALSTMGVRQIRASGNCMRGYWPARAGQACSLGLLALMVWSCFFCETAEDVLERKRQAYMRAEGHDKRGPRFDDFAGVFYEGRCVVGSGNELSEAELLRYLGPPDLVSSSAGERLYAYFYDRFADRDWVLYVKMVDGKVDSFGWNDASANDHTGFQAFQRKEPTE